MPLSQLTAFFEAIKDNNRISTSHISLYMALFEIWSQNDFQHPLCVTRKQVMDKAKISGIATFHKCIKDLSEYSYIEYFPSKNPSIRSRVVILKL